MRGYISEEELDQVLHADEDNEDAPSKVKPCTRFPRRCQHSSSIL